MYSAISATGVAGLALPEPARGASLAHGLEPTLMTTSSVQHGRDTRVCAESDPVAFRSWRRELRQSLAAGAALASLTAATGCDEDTVVGGAPIPTPNDAHLANISLDSGTTPDSSVTPAAPDGSLQPYPLESVTCIETPDAGPYYGPQCCFEAACYVPPDGAACTSDLARLPVGDLSPHGIGYCGCSLEGHPAAQGPFARNPAHPTDSAIAADATCCYVIGSRQCLGRPFVVGGLGRIAPLAARSDWNLFT